ncbi:cell division protein SepF [Saccharopolyspora gloriosae]|uniref:Cell division protein SepF n=1 Tax=Saccharopolyspora gloriosae TaxID=455344 RepID=A0A840NJF5_9PSEU|nr:cell division protein SepF [Saccharopolyspora gloriosae]MBB5071191.1 cell division inhibitor SepF [Saccharopolyspora gloriosae]
MSTMHKLKAYFGMVPADEVDEFDDDIDRYGDADEYDSPADRVGGRRRVGVRGGYQDEAEADEGFDDHGSRDAPRRDTGHRGEEYREVKPPRRQWSPETAARTAAERESVSRLRAVTDTGSHFNLSKITTLHPRSYSEARTIGEQYRDGTPVIMNLTEMDEADAKRLVDFAAGLAFAMRGSIEKVTNRVFLLSPPNVDVAAEDKRRLAEGAFFNYG